MTDGQNPWSFDHDPQPDPVDWLDNCRRRDALNGYDPHQSLDDLATSRPAVYGVDGDRYTAYVYDHPYDELYKVVIDHIDYVEDLSFPRDAVPDNQRGDGVLVRWLNDRTDPSPRPLTAAPSYQRTRLDAEETILACALSHPDRLESLRWVPTGIFTGELRRAAYAALREMQPFDARDDLEALVGQTRRQMQPLTPEQAFFRSEPDPATYLRRLAVTRAQPGAAIEAAYQLSQWDLRESLRTQAADRVHRVTAPDASRPIPKALPMTSSQHQPIAPPVFPPRPLPRPDT